MKARKRATSSKHGQPVSIPAWKSSANYEAAKASVTIAKVKAWASAYAAVAGRAFIESDEAPLWFLRMPWLIEHSATESFLISMAVMNGVRHDERICPIPGAPKWAAIISAAAYSGDLGFIRKLLKADDSHKPDYPIQLSRLDCLLIDHWLELPEGQPGLCFCTDAVIVQVLSIFSGGIDENELEVATVNRRIRNLKLVRASKLIKKFERKNRHLTIY